MAQQYGYGYGYQSYGYVQPATVPPSATVLPTASAYTGYSAPAPRAHYPLVPAPTAHLLNRLVLGIRLIRCSSLRQLPLVKHTYLLHQQVGILLIYISPPDNDV